MARVEIPKIRQDKGMSQQELATRLGYRTNSYISDMEKGKFVPSQEKLREIAQALAVPFTKIKDSLLESRLNEMGIRDPVFINLVKDYPRLSREDKEAIFKVYFKIRKRIEKVES